VTILQRKILLLGDIGVGKTSLARRFVFDRFEASYKTTIGVDILTHDVRIDGSATDIMRMVLWDTDGDFGQSIFETTYARGASAAIVVSDLTRPATLAKQIALLDAFDARSAGRPSLAILNKSDLADYREALAEVAQVSDMVRSTSALTGDGVASAFTELASTMLRRGL
jgi:small GTP-binding protein